MNIKFEVYFKEIQMLKAIVDEKEGIIKDQ